MQAKYPDDLLTCGLYSSLTMLNLYKACGDSLTWLPSGKLETIGNAFAGVGLNATNEAYAYDAQDAISTSMSTP